MASSSHSATQTGEIVAYENDGQPVRLVYDTWTPRPHLIIVQKQGTQNASSTDLQAACEMIARFLRENPQFDEQAIFSFHCGKWYQQHTPKWHAHLCVPKEPYLKAVKNLIKIIPTNKEWRGAKTVEEGMNNWHTRKVKDYENYRNECVQKRIPSQTLAENVSLTKFDGISSEFQLAWSYPDPNISIVVRSSSSVTLLALYDFMSNVRSKMVEQLTRVDPSFANFGCHLCLYVRGQTDTKVIPRPGQIFAENGQVKANENIVGYIKMEESQYVQWLPSNLRQVWLDGFRQVPYFVRT